MTDRQKIRASIGSRGARGACLLGGKENCKSGIHVSVTIVTTTSIILLRSVSGDDQTKVHNVGHGDMLSEHKICLQLVYINL